METAPYFLLCLNVRAHTLTNLSILQSLKKKKEPKFPKVISYTFGGWEILGQGAGRFGSC